MEATGIASIVIVVAATVLRFCRWSEDNGFIAFDRSVARYAVAMKTQLASRIKASLPPGIVATLRPLRNVPRATEKRITQRIFAAADEEPFFLGAEALESLQKRYPGYPEYGYDAEILEKRGTARASEIMRLPGAREAESFLELGCWDGMVSCALNCMGKRTTAVDYRDTGFDERARGEGVRLLQMDAASLRFEDESFDIVFSYDAFEHFASPEDVLGEAIRVVKDGGYIYLEFGPLYFSPLGEHAYRSITVPYCQFLFTKTAINEFAVRNGLSPIDFSHVNGWSIERFRALWERYSHVIRKIRYREILDLSHLNLIRAYPECFRSKSSYFDNFVVSNISALFQKRSR